MNCLPCLVLSRSVLSVPTICPFLFSLYTDLIDSYLFLTRMLEKTVAREGKEQLAVVLCVQVLVKQKLSLK